ncbi:D-alanyl-D-alanine carboxypeptidase [Alkalispirochaeta americana]|uniref:D-alanyl-D-alanine carboxypeptidase n=1 Tax=Alkalispirochaeta americana TaxID=159291 RepID=A0A1N6SVJ5_9SPIO|nr:serine hydrolase domain-containing protein [Alkalispirochaeta americana]SIQ45109.1 D-alanyl-D-alanine carboxypeptidase [Alkalispirochaeta americana]
MNDNSVQSPGRTRGLEIEALFHRHVERDPTIRNAYLLVHSDTLGIHMNLAAGPGEGQGVSPQQPVFMASVGKLFTSVILATLHEQGVLSFHDPIERYLPPEMMKNLHVWKGKDYSSNIQIRHLLNQTSGLPDNFFPLLKKVMADHTISMTPQDAVEWTKGNLTPRAAPGKRAHYTDTNYHLLGLIVEEVCGEPFHIVLKKVIFDPVGMKGAYMLHRSEPAAPSSCPEAGFYIGETRLNNLKALAGIDYAGGGVVAPMEDLLLFMKALVGLHLVSRDTLAIMKDDKANLYPGFDYGYGIWQVRPVPLLIPPQYDSWGVLGATGAYMFYHPALETYLIGSFNHTSWQKKCVRFMFKVMRLLHGLK